MGFFDSIMKGVKSTFGKNTNGVGGLLNKAKTFINSGLSALNSKTGKNILGAISQYAPSVGEAVGSLKKYGNIANNILNGGAEKKGERFIKQSPILAQMDRWDMPTKPVKFHHQEMKAERMPTIEKVRAPRREPEDAQDFGINSMFA